MATVLNRFDPTTFPTAMDADPLRNAASEANNSGAPVLAATMVRPIALSWISSNPARVMAPSTRTFPPSHSPRVPKISSELVLIALALVLSSSSSSSTDEFLRPFL